jgi:hypothetical protein
VWGNIEGECLKGIDCRQGILQVRERRQVDMMWEEQGMTNGMREGQVQKTTS